MGDPTDTLGLGVRPRSSSQRSATLSGLGQSAAQLQARSGALADVASVLSRIDDLKTADTSLDGEEQSERETEFRALQAQLVTIGRTSAAGNLLSSGSASAAGVATGTAVAFRDDFASADRWVSSAGDLSVSDNTFYPNANGGYGAVETQASFAGAFELSFDLFLPGAVDSLDISLGGALLSNLTDTVNTTKWEWHSVRIAYDGVGTASTYVDGASTAADQQTEVGSASGPLMLANLGLGSARIRNLSLTPTPGSATSATSSAGDSSLAQVAAATELASLDASTLEDAIAELAAHRAENAVALSNLEAATEQMDGPDGIAGSELTDEEAAGAATASVRRLLFIDTGQALLAQANISTESVRSFLE